MDLTRAFAQVVSAGHGLRAWDLAFNGATVLALHKSTCHHVRRAFVARGSPRSSVFRDLDDPLRGVATFLVDPRLTCGACRAVRALCFEQRGSQLPLWGCHLCWQGRFLAVPSHPADMVGWRAGSPQRPTEGQEALEDV